MFAEWKLLTVFLTLQRLKFAWWGKHMASMTSTRPKYWIAWYRWNAIVSSYSGSCLLWSLSLSCIKLVLLKRISQCGEAMASLSFQNENLTAMCSLHCRNTNLLSEAGHYKYHIHSSEGLHPIRWYATATIYSGSGLFVASSFVSCHVLVLGGFSRRTRETVTTVHIQAAGVLPGINPEFNIWLLWPCII